MNPEKRIAKIASAHIEWEDHGIFTAWLSLNYGSSAQGAGLYALDEWSEEENRRVGTAQGLEFIMLLMKACGVRRWEDLPGRTVFAWTTQSKVLGVGPLPTEEGTTFMFADLFAPVQEGGFASDGATKEEK